MKIKLLFLLICFSLTNAFAQLDREHWFAPMVDRSTSPNPFQKVYLSTNRTTPFPVSIYNNNNLIGTVTISKGNPQKFDILRSYIITTLQSDLFTPTTKGIYLKAEFPFYANLRFSVFQHAEIITSKGIPSTGTKFYAAMTPITVSNNILNFTTGILATEDNTTVTVSNYKPTVQFSNGTTGTTNPTITFTLNKGQSYIIEGSGANNTDGFIGAKIVSNKPINVTNGNFNGQYAGNFPNSSDIEMDQSVPVNQLGNEFALVKGNGTIGINMEGAIVIATENNTQIFVNDEIPPLATLNEGQYFVIPDTKYRLQGSNHYNLRIRTTKNAYVYQTLAGEPSGGVATGGFNFIPALNCYLPKQINELGLIDENYLVSSNNPNGILNIPTKLNLVTETGAVVTVNGVAPPSSTGPFPMAGTANWVTYGIPNVSGNITVNSTKAITAGITAGSDVAGYGGFFAGFPTQPIIIKTGTNCFPGMTLTVDPIIYDSYQWYNNGILIPGQTGSSINPTEPGNYTASVTMGSCAPLITEQYKVTKCLVSSSSSYSICTNQTITPVLSNPSIPQAIVPSSVNITSAPTLGTATIDSTTGVITYTPTTPNVAGTDTFTYNFCGNHPDFPECETVTVTINILQIPVNNATLNACNINGQGTFDLTSANVTTQTNVTLTYYPTFADAQNDNVANAIVTPNIHSATAGTIVYVLVKSTLGCKSIAQITLNLFPLASVIDFTQTNCDDNLDGFVNVNLSNITPLVLTNPTYFAVRYYPTLVDANAGNTNTLPNNWTYSVNTTIYIRVDSPDGCAPVVKPLNFLIGDKLNLLTTDITHSVCDDDLDGVKQVDLSPFIGDFTTDPAVTVTYHSSLIDAQNDAAAITSSVSVNTIGAFYIRFEKTGECPNIGKININVKIPKKSDLADLEICNGTKTILDAGAGFEAYLWSTGETTQSISNVGIGTYWVDLTFNGCVYRQTINITAAPLPEITSIDINQGNVIINVTGGTPPYQYSLDGINWQISNFFYDIPRGAYTAYVKDFKECAVVEKDFSIINLINAITPNGDGQNEVIDYSELLTKHKPVFRIFDRYGKEMFNGTASNRFTWNGKTQNGRPVPTATYWYILQWQEPGTQTFVKHTSWLLVKNRNDNFFEK